MARQGLLLLFITVLAAVAGAQPVIVSGTGTLSHGESVVLLGGDFGSKASAAPLKFDDFEAGEPGTVIQGWDTDVGGGTQEPEYSDTFVRLRSQRSAVCIYEGSQYLSTFGLYRPEGLTHVYLDFWVLFDKPDPPSRNHKLYRLYPQRTSGLPNQYLQIYCPENSPTARFTNDGVAGEWSDTHAHPGWVSEEAQHKWVHMQVYLEQSSAGINDGVLQAWFDCGHTVDRTDYRSRDPVNDADWHSVWFGNYNGHGADDYCAASGDAYIYFDDVYVDVTRARVELGDAATYAACTHREIQIPSAWSPDSITIRVNVGTLEEGAPLWLFVVDEGGRVSPGFGPVMLGGRLEDAGSLPGKPGQPVRTP